MMLEDLGAVRARREELLVRMTGLEEAAAVTGDAETRWVTVRTRLRELQEAFDRHVEATERPDGFLAEAVAHAPHLEHRRRELINEHREIAAKLAASLDATAEAATREDVADLLVTLERHRHRGAELIYEAYSVDMGPSD